MARRAPSRARLLLASLLARGDAAASDHKLREGELPAGATPAPRRLVFVHVPRAAGSSAMNRAAAHLPVGTTLIGSGEAAAWNQATRARRGIDGKLVTFARFPLALALSQFLYCKFQLRRRKRGFPRWSPRTKGPLRGLDEWAAHFPNNSSFSCYDPTDIQFRFVAGSGHARSAGGVPRTASLDRALSFLRRDFFFVGVVELFSESLCALALRATGSAPQHCGCGFDSNSKRTHQKAKRLANVSLDSLEPRRLEALARLVPRDLTLYVAALRRFEEQVAGTDLVCPGKIDALFAKALPYACAGAPRAATERVLRGSARRC
mmetsp:Transcript_28606/g.88699  ORF Transcript_28606/g.88699 Transcript_28606/m.88699 type:complete len:320 (-) Transcript_28606:11-970(-)